MSKPQYLLDVNILIALTQPEHLHHSVVMNWFNTPGLNWGLCAFSEVGFLRISSNPAVGKLTVEDGTKMLAALAKHRGYRFWPISAGWAALAAPFQERVFGHQQITDAYLLGLAVKENGILVTTDKAIRFLAGSQYSKNVLVLESGSGYNA
jgi:toxin-antitoxin system PIN domain toxin